MSEARTSIYLGRRGGMRAWIGGDAMVWFSGGAVTLAVIAVVGLIGLLAWHGLAYFWPRELILYDTPEGRVLGERVARETVAREQLLAAGVKLEHAGATEARLLVKRGNRDVFETDFSWLLESRIAQKTMPADAVRVERLEWGNLYGYLESVSKDGVVVADAAVDREATWTLFSRRLEAVTDLREKIEDLEKSEVGAINHAMERLRLEERGRTMEGMPAATPEIKQRRRELEASFESVRLELLRLYAELDRHSYRVRLADGQVLDLPLGKVVRAIRPNRMSRPEKITYFGERLWEFLSDDPREANTEGGVYPAIFGTVMMVLLMSVIVTPFGVLAALFLHEVARQGRTTRVIRAAVNNLAGVPSIVYGIFGLGFFVYGLGGELDRLLFPEALPSPTYGTPGILWASLTLALLTLPVVIVATEEGLARIPQSIREGSLALGATRAETLWWVVLPMASPAMMTGMILAVARAAGEVAPLMLVGVVKLAPTLPLDGNYPYLHLEQKFMHLGFHIYDVGFQSPNIEAARPLVYATALLLVIIIALLNVAAIALRNRLRERYSALDTG